MIFWWLKKLAVHGVEYAFGAHEYPSTGIFEGEPRQCEGFTFRKSILIGWTDMSPTQVKVLMEQLAVKYRGNAYNLISKNCNHFCNDACIKLTTNPIPNWINRLARIGQSYFLFFTIFDLVWLVFSYMSRVYWLMQLVSKLDNTIKLETLGYMNQIKAN